MSILQKISHPELISKGVSLTVKRDDLIHPVISGNKLFKLKYYLEEASEQGFESLLTFGGAFSNHLHATAYAAKLSGLRSVGVVRGEQIWPLNPTLQDCVNWGMTLHPVSRISYKQKAEANWLSDLISYYPDSYLIPEGGSGELGIKGAETILADVPFEQFDYVVAACGTGTTLAGLIRASAGKLKIVGIPVLKNAGWMYEEIQTCLSSNKCLNHWELWLDYHFGGYGKYSEKLQMFIQYVYKEFELPLDKIYTGKAFYGLMDQINQGFFPVGSRVLFCHTGGLQGMR